MKPDEIRAFAAAEVLPTLPGRYETRSFSRDLWKRMAGAGLFDFLLPGEFGGSDRDATTLLDTVDAFLTGGCDLGLCLSWLDHLMIHTLVIHRFGSPDQRKEFLPALVQGDRIGALAASEPGTGANPVKMQSTAEKGNGHYTIRGHKIFITNGPVADRVIVLARTGPLPGKEGISAFLLETSTPGFEVRQVMDFGFLNTSPHGELVFHDCRVPSQNLLGRIGEGHMGISRAVFAWERYVLLAALAAHFRTLLDRLIREVARPAGARSRETERELATAHVVLEGLTEITRERAVEVLGRTGLDRRGLQRLLFIGHAFHQWWESLENLLDRVDVPDDPVFSILWKDARLLQINHRLFASQMDRVARDLLLSAPG
jgi:alkylation response protein AidB-like acyl-CoA dehydrogenase